MANETIFDSLGQDYLYNNLPAVYRTLDNEQKLILKRLLEAIQGGGLEPILQSIIDMVDVNLVDNLNQEELKLLGKTFGYEYSYTLPIERQRKIIKNIVEIFKRKGTKSSVIFVAKEITGFDTEISDLGSKVFRTWSTNQHNELEGYTTPRTYKAGNADNSRYLGKKHRGSNVVIKLTPLAGGILKFDMVMALIEILKMVLPVYTNPFLLVSSIELPEDYTPILDEYDLFVLKDLESYTVKPDIEYLNIDISILASLEDSNPFNYSYQENTIIRLITEDEIFSNALSEVTYFNDRYVYREEYIPVAIDEDSSKIIFLPIEEAKNLIKSKTSETNLFDIVSEQMHVDIEEEADRHWGESTDEHENPFLIKIKEYETFSASGTTESDLPMIIRIKSSDEVFNPTVLEEMFTIEDTLTSGYGLILDGISSRAYTESNPLSSGAKTIAVKVKPSASNDDYARIVQASTASNTGWSIRLLGNKIIAQVKEYSIDYNAASSDLVFDGEHEYQIHLTFDGTNTPKLFIDGVLQSGTATDEAGDDGGTGIYVGAKTGGTSYFFDGIVRDLVLYSRAMSDIEVEDDQDYRPNGNESGLQAYWKFDDMSGSEAQDYTLNENNMTVVLASWLYTLMKHDSGDALDDKYEQAISLAKTDSGTGTDTKSAQAVNISKTDSGTGTDTMNSNVETRVINSTDSGTAAETVTGISQTLYISVSDSGTATESHTLDEGSAEPTITLIMNNSKLELGLGSGGGFAYNYGATIAEGQTPLDGGQVIRCQQVCDMLRYQTGVSVASGKKVRFRMSIKADPSYINNADTQVFMLLRVGSTDTRVNLPTGSAFDWTEFDAEYTLSSAFNGEIDVWFKIEGSATANTAYWVRQFEVGWL